METVLTPEELPDVILKLEESTGSSSRKMKKRKEVAKSSRRFVKSEETSEEQPRSSTGKRYFKSGSTLRAQQKRTPIASKGYLYSRGSSNTIFPCFSFPLKIM
jgi:RNA-binding protein